MKPAPDYGQLEDRVMLSAAPAAVALPAVDSSLDPLATVAVDEAVTNQVTTADRMEPVADVTTVLEVTDPADQPSFRLASNQDAQELRRELVVVDASASDYQQLIDDLLTQDSESRHLEVVLLDGQRDGIDQLSEILSDYDDLAAVHVVSHGVDGAVKLGGTWLSLDNVGGYAGQLVGWRDALAFEADLLFYGCDVAGSDDGVSLLESLAVLTGADVAASTDETGDAKLGGDWELEFARGAIEAGIAFSSDAQQSWAHLMAVETVRDEFTTSAYSGNQGTQNWSNDWQEIGESDGHSAGNVSVVADPPDNQLQFLSVADVGAWREVDLSGASTATLNFDYQRSSWLGPAFEVRVRTSAATPWSSAASIFSVGDGTDGSTQLSGDVNLTPYISSTTQIAFYVTGNGSGSVTVDNVQIAYEVSQPPTIALPGAAINYTENDPATLIDPLAIVTAGDATDFNTGQLTIDFTANGTTHDRLAIRNEGTGSGQIGISGANVLYGGTTIGTFSGGTNGSTPLVVTFNASSSPVAAQALIRNISYQNVSDDPSTAARTLRFVLTDGYGGTSNAATQTVNVTSVTDHTVVVDTTDDTDDGVTTNIDTLLANRGADGLISLREAITAANNTNGADSILFDIAGTGTHVLQPDEPLPGITGQVTIDATSDSSFAANGNRPAIVLAGTDAGTSDGLVLSATADGSTIRGLVLRDWKGTGIVIQAGSDNHWIAGNYIGNLTTGGTDAGLLENTVDGITVFGDNNIVGGTDAADRNVIAGNDVYGIRVFGTGNTIQGNYIGLDATGIAALTNADDAIYVDNSPSTTIGGTAAGAGNVINAASGVAGIDLTGTLTTAAMVQGNLIGTDKTGTVQLSGGSFGISLKDVAGATVGGTTTEAANTIGGYLLTGVSLSVGGSGSKVQGNHIGTDAAGTRDLTNGLYGITVQNGVGNLEIGGTVQDAGNRIANNSTNGVRVHGNAGTGISIRHNAIYDNTGLGIDLGGDGVTANDSADADTGPNNLQNYPVITKAVVANGRLTISGYLESNAGTSLTLDFYATGVPNGSGHGEAPSHLGSLTVDTDGSGYANFRFTALSSLTLGDFVTATATSPTGTSEFSANVATTAAANVLWISTDIDSSAPGADGLPGGWQEGDVLELGGPDLALGTTTDGDLSHVIDFDTFVTPASGGVDVGALHFVSRNLTVGGGANSLPLQAGDVLVSFNQDETIQAAYFDTGSDQLVDNQDLLLFRPTTVGDYSAGTFYMLLDDIANTSGGTINSLHGISLVEQSITVGGTPLAAGTFIFSEQGGVAEEDIYHFTATGVGLGSTSGTTTTLIDGSDIDIEVGMAVRGLELIESPITVGGMNFSTGSILVTLRDNDAAVGDAPSIAADRQDIFVLDVTATGIGSTAATARMVLDGSQVNLDSTPVSEAIYAIAILPEQLPPNISLPGGAVNFTEGDPATIIDGAATVIDIDSSDFDTGQLTVDFAANGTVNDRLAIRHEGTGAGQIGVSGPNVSYGGTTIGTFAGGTDGSTPLVITFNADSTPAAAQALLRNITYANVSDNPSTVARTIRFALTDGDGGTSNTATQTVNVTSVTDHVIVVDTTDDTDDGVTTNIDTLLANRGADGLISLREAITAANNTGNFDGSTPDEIRFAIPADDARHFYYSDDDLPGQVSAGFITTTTASDDGLIGDIDPDFARSWYSIQVGAALPTITEALVIDGTTQMGFIDTPIVELNGTTAGAGVDGLLLSVGSNGSTIQGLVINNFNNHAIQVNGSSNSTIAGNFLGTDSSGTLDQGNAITGIFITNGASNNTIGGLTAADRNIISGNGDDGLKIEVTAGSGNTVVGNYIGLDVSGTSSLGNGGSGVDVQADGNTIGGTAAEARNIISGNTFNGIVSSGSGNTVQGNYIGADVNGNALFGNARNGIWLNGGSNNLIGGTAAGAGNLVVANAWNGIRVSNATATGNAILGNSIYTNAGLGLDLNADGVTANDAGDGDTGENNLQNFPVLNTASTNGVDSATIDGSLNSLANTTFRIEFFSNPAGTGDPSGYGEGRTYLGFTTITTDGSGNATINTTLPVGVVSGELITATATVDLGGGNYGNTSEFSQNVAANVVPTINLPGAPVNYTENDPATAIDPSATIVDSDSSDFATGTLTIDFTAGGTANDRLTIRNEGTGAGQVGVSGSNVTYNFGAGAMTVGTFSGGTDGSTPLVITFNADSTPAAAQALLRNITYENVSEDPTTAARTVRFVLTDGDGGVSNVDTKTINLSGDNRLIVTTVLDINDGDTSNIDALLADRGGDGEISLHEALLAVNNTTNVGPADEIHFDLGGVGPHVISLAFALPEITEAVIIDGWSEPDFATTPVVRIDGNGIVGSADGLWFSSTADNSVVRGLMITRFTRYGLQIDSGANNITIAGNWIGTTGTGSTGVGNDDNGINVQGANTTIGGTGANEGNVITNNDNEGINLTGTGATGTVIQGNIIGLDPDGVTGPGNKDVGIALLSGSHNTTIGGTTAAARNVISNNFEGIEINSNNNVIQGNYIGTDITGTLARGNHSDDGIEIQNGGTGNIIGGSTAGAGNIIADNARHGINIVSAVNTTIQGNTIGSGVAGTENLGNSWSGIYLAGPSNSNVLIGGLQPGEGNLIAFNQQRGIETSGTGGDDRIEGNVIHSQDQNGIRSFRSGTLIAGNIVYSNSQATASDEVVIGNSHTVYHNTIHGSAADGVSVEGTGAVIRNNIITGSAGFGIRVAGGTVSVESHNLITDAVTGPANLGGQANFTVDTTTLNADPQYVNAGTGDFALTEPGSPAINTGVDLGAQQPDRNGTGPGLYTGSAPDMGALESSVVNGPPAISLPGASLNFSENDPATIIDGGATVSDPTSANFDGGTLTVDFTANGTANDRLSIRDQGLGIGNIVVSGSDISYDDGALILIGSFTGGTHGSDPLVVTFNSAATPARVQSLLRNVTFGNVSENPSESARTVRFVLTDGDGGTSNSATTTINITAVNDDPNADAGGPYTIREGESLDLDASATTDAEGDTLTFDWDLNNDGSFGDDTGETLTVNWATLVGAGIDDDGSHVIGLRVSDNNGGVDTTTVAVTVLNTAPTLSATGSAAVDAGSNYTLNLSATDPGTDTITEWMINWGDGTFQTIAGNPSSVTHPYLLGGSFNILVSATDEDGTHFNADLMIAQEGTNSVLRFAYDGATGAAALPYVQELTPTGPTVLSWPEWVTAAPDGYIYVAGYGSDNILRFDAVTGVQVDPGAFISTNNPIAVAFGRDGDLYVTSDQDSNGNGLREVRRFDGTTGAFIEYFTEFSFTPEALAFGPDGHLYVASWNTNRIFRFDAETGAQIDPGAFILPTGTGDDLINTPGQFTWGPDGHLYVVSVRGNENVLKYHGMTGAFLGEFAQGFPAGGWPAGPTGVAFGPDGDLYLVNKDRVLRFDGTDGTPLPDYVPAGNGLNDPWYVSFAPSHQVAVNGAPLVALKNTMSSLPETTDTTSSLKVADISVLDDPLGARNLTLNGTDKALFEIVGGTELHLRAGVTLDFETNPVLDVTVEVNDPDLAPAPNDIAVLSIAVTDAAEPPQITSNGGGATAGINVTENSVTVTTVTAIDDDLPAQTLSYSISGGVDAGRFGINPTTGELAFATPADFEQPTDVDLDNVYEVIVQVSDGGLTDTQAILVTVVDANDVPLITTTNLNAAENQNNAGMVMATDQDLPADTLTWSLTGNGADDARFSIDGGSGQLTFNVAPDLETPGDADADNVYEVEVRVFDGMFAAIKAVTVTVVDANDAPLITTTNLNATENQAIAGSVLATDQDLPADTLTWSLTGSGADDARFSIDGGSGQLTFNTLPDFETPGDANGDNVYEVEVQVFDGTVATTKAITVTVVDANDAPLISTTNLNAAENQTNAGSVTATDQDLPADTLTWSLTGSGADDARFTIDGGSGQLTFNVAPDLETPDDANGDNVYEVEVRVFDGTVATIKAITVTVVDANDAPIISTTNLNAAENQNLAGNVTATDQDLPADTLTWSLTGSGADDARFSIDGGSGQLTFNTLPDFETPGDANGDNVYEVEVQVFDGTVATIKAITVTVVDANDAPVISTNNLNATENQTVAGSVTATDQDLPADSLAWSLTGSGTDDARFTIDGGNGQLTFNVVPDFESPGDANADNVYEVEVRVFDGTVATTKTITVTVSDNNDAPLITTNNLNATENQTVAGSVTATDQDLPADTLTWSLTGNGADDARFSIDGGSGQLTFNVVPDLETPGDANGDNVYEVEVRVFDGTVATIKAITVTVIDANDAPVITTTNLNAAENQAIAGSVLATDQDLPADTLTWSLTGSGADDARFSIDGGSGQLTFNTLPDFETPGDANGDNVYEVEVQVFDGTVATTKAITVTVVDANDAPLISTTNLNAAENQTDAGSVTATDQDLPADTLTWSLTGSGADDARFSIDGGSGQLTFNVAPDLETPGDANADNVYEVEVRVFDGTVATIKAITVTVVDANDAPIISTTNLNAAENQNLAGSVTATDQDLPADSLTWSLTGSGGADDARFSIDGGSGQLTFNTLPDFETPGDANGDNVYEVEVQVFDGTVATIKAITVTVVDANDVPIISTNNLNATENQTVAGSVTATDQDLPADSLAWSLTGSGADDARFTIDGGNGQLTFNVVPDFESPGDANADNVYEVEVRVFDGTVATTKTITVTVSDNNDAPLITTNNLNATENQTVAGSVTATDQDLPADTLTWSLTGNGADDARFSIDGGSGQLTFNVAPDLETPGDANGDNVYEVEVRVFDGTVATIKAITVTVIDANDAPLITTTNLNAAENQTNAGSVLATDQDLPADSLTWSLTGSGADDARFSIDGGSGQLTFNMVPNFETPGDANADNIYEVQVQVHDGTAATIKAVTVTIVDANDAPTVNPATFSVAENLPNGTIVGSVAATDPDAGDVLTYSITAGNTSNAFQIDSSTGEITVDNSSALDFEVTPTFTITVQVSDTGASTDTATITINLTDINDAPSSNDDTFTVSETSPNGTLVGVVSASDTDTGQSLTFAIIGGDPTSVFQIDPTSGAITLDDSSQLDGAVTPTYNLTVEATDNGTPNLSDTASIVILVTDINQSPVVNDQTFWVNENRPNNQSLGTIVFNDADFSDTHSVSIIGGTGATAFAIDSVSGEITVADSGQLDYESTTSLSLDVQVTDDGTPSLSDSATITINVNPLNDNLPVAGADSVTVDFGGTVAVLDSAAGSVLDNDADADLPADTLVAVLDSGPSHAASFTLNPDGTFSYVHDGSDTQTDSFSYHVFDGTNSSTAIVVTINIVSDLPAGPLPDDVVTIEEDVVTEDASSEESVTEESQESNSLAQTPAVQATPPPNVPSLLDRSLQSTVPVERMAQPLTLGLATQSLELGDEPQLVEAYSYVDAAQQRIAQSVRPVIQLLGSTATNLVEFVNPGFLWEQFDNFEQGLKQGENTIRLAVGGIAVASITLTATYVFWTVKGGYLMASILSQMPAWKFIDPLPIYDAPPGVNMIEEEDDEDALLT